MEKKIRVMSILSLAACGLAFLLLLLCVLLQRWLLPVFYPGVIEELSFVFPWGAFLYCLGLLCTSLILLLGSANLRIGPWLEILCIVAGGVLPGVMNRVASLLQTYFAGQYGSVHIATLTAMNSLAGFPLGVAQLGFVLLLVTCGMSIAYKNIIKSR